MVKFSFFNYKNYNVKKNFFTENKGPFYAFKKNEGFPVPKKED